MTDIQPRWTKAQVEALFAKPLMDLLFEAQQIHRQHFDPNRVQVSTLLSIKTGACPEDCKYCPQSARYNTGVEQERLMETDKVLAAAKRAKEQGRSDDTPEVIAKRLETYEKETAPLLDIYKQRGLLISVNGVGEIDEISNAIIAELDANVQAR